MGSAGTHQDHAPRYPTDAQSGGKRMITIEALQIENVYQQARIAELELERDGWMKMVGKIAATIPAKDTIGATGTLGDMIKYLNNNQARIAQLKDALTLLIELNDNHSPFGGEMYQDRIERTWGAARAALKEST
jgi:hypothetical protein